MSGSTGSIEHWSLVCSKDEFVKLKNDPAFRTLVKLARAANAVRFCHLVLIANEVDETPAAQRRRLNAFLYLSAVLYEAILLAKGELGKHFRDVDVFQEAFTPIFRDRNVENLVENILKRLRNHGVFHFTDEEIPDGLNELEQDTYAFASGFGEQNGQVYYALADEALFRAALGLKGSWNEIHDALQKFVRDTAALSTRFSDAADRLIARVLADPIWIIQHD